MLDYRDEQIEELKFALNGGVRAKGDMQNGNWEINISSILTKLIQEAGRWCDSYASDLFIQWQWNVMQPLTTKMIKSETIVFAFRESGVDSNSWYENNKDISNYYRAVWFLDVSVNGGKIEMVLHK